MISVFWKAPTDTSAWVKLGLAIRLAYQLRLHQPRKRDPLPPDMAESRKVVVSVGVCPTKTVLIVQDGERTWMC